MNKDQEWLENNKNLRMDANNDYFDKARGKFHRDRYEFAQKYCENKMVLDGACGTGYGSNILSEVAHGVIGIDNSPDTIEYAHKVYGNEKTKFENSFVEITPYANDFFDIIVSFETVEHTLCPKSHLNEIVRLLKNNGLALLSVPNKWGLTDYHFWDFDYLSFKNLCETYFSKVEYYYNNSDKYKEFEGIGEYDEKIPCECIIAICSQPKKYSFEENSYSTVMSEIYQGVFKRHQENLCNLKKKETRLNKIIKFFLGDK